MESPRQSQAPGMGQGGLQGEQTVVFTHLCLSYRALWGRPTGEEE